jgi:hypothetical protein
MTIEGSRPTPEDYLLILQSIKEKIAGSKVGSVKLVAFADAIEYYSASENYHKSDKTDEILRAAICLDIIALRIQDRQVSIKGYIEYYHEFIGMMEQLGTCAEKLNEKESPNVLDDLYGVRNSQINSND